MWSVHESIANKRRRDDLWWLAAVFVIGVGLAMMLTSAIK